jgi:hypothetical protein
MRGGTDQLGQQPLYFLFAFIVLFYLFRIFFFFFFSLSLPGCLAYSKRNVTMISFLQPALHSAYDTSIPTVFPVQLELRGHFSVLRPFGYSMNYYKNK